MARIPKQTAAPRAGGRAARTRPRGSAAALVQIAIAVPDLATAAGIATALLERRLCACVQTVGPVTSRYRWRGNLETASEYLLLVKTRRACYGAVEAAVLALHPYEVPEILATRVQAAWAPYAAWVAESAVPPVRAARTPRRAGKRVPAPRVRAPRTGRSGRNG